MRTQIDLYFDPDKAPLTDAVFALFPLGHQRYVRENVDERGSAILTFEANPVTPDIEEYVNYLLKRGIIWNASYGSPIMGFEVNEQGQRTSEIYTLDEE